MCILLALVVACFKLGECAGGKVAQCLEVDAVKTGAALQDRGPCVKVQQVEERSLGRLVKSTIGNTKTDIRPLTMRDGPAFCRIIIMSTGVAALSRAFVGAAMRFRTALSD